MPPAPKFSDLLLTTVLYSKIPPVCVTPPPLPVTVLSWMKQFLTVPPACATVESAPVMPSISQPSIRPFEMKTPAPERDELEVRQMRLKRFVPPDW